MDTTFENAPNIRRSLRAKQEVDYKERTPRRSIRKSKKANEIKNKGNISVELKDSDDNTATIKRKSRGNPKKRNYGAVLETGTKTEESTSHNMNINTSTPDSNAGEVNSNISGNGNNVDINALNGSVESPESDFVLPANNSKSNIPFIDETISGKSSLKVGDEKEISETQNMSTQSPTAICFAKEKVLEKSLSNMGNKEEEGDCSVVEMLDSPIHISKDNQDTHPSDVTSVIKPDGLYEDLNRSLSFQIKEVGNISTLQTPPNFKEQSLPSSTPIMKPRIPNEVANTDKKASKSSILRKSQSHILSRKPTPYKAASAKKIKTALKLMSPSEIDKTVTFKDISPVNVKIITNNEEMKLRSIRKRSVSESGKYSKGNRVTFHSPSNVTIPFDDSKHEIQGEIDSSYVTKRRKRSLSMTETNAENQSIFGNRSVADCTPIKSIKKTRSKVPNFAAIHQQSFKKMESIFDYVSRKAERAKLLNSPTTKNKLADQKPSLNRSNILKSVERKNLIKQDNSATVLPLMQQKPNPYFKHSATIVPKVAKSDIKNTTKDIAKTSKDDMKKELLKTDKVRERQRRNMDSYKSRPQQPGKEQQGKKSEILKGVRTNRRFELQMIYRNQREQ